MCIVLLWCFIRCVRDRANDSGPSGAQCDRPGGHAKFPRRQRSLSAAPAFGGNETKKKKKY